MLQNMILPHAKRYGSSKVWRKVGIHRCIYWWSRVFYGRSQIINWLSVNKVLVQAQSTFVIKYHLGCGSSPMRIAHYAWSTINTFNLGCDFPRLGWHIVHGALW